MNRKKTSMSLPAGTGNWRSPGAANPADRACRAVAGFDSQTGLLFLAILGFVWLAGAQAWPADQGCPMCREAAEAAGDGEAFNAGILLMLGLVYGVGAILVWSICRHSKAAERARVEISNFVGR